MKAEVPKTDLGASGGRVDSPFCADVVRGLSGGRDAELGGPSHAEQHHQAQPGHGLYLQ